MTCQSCGNELAPTLKFCPKCGTPAGTPSYTPPAEQMQSSWSQNPQYAMNPPQRKSRAGKILLIIGIVLILLVAAAGAAVYFGYRYIERTIKSSEAYTMAEARLKESAAVKERIGEIKSTGFPIGSFTENSDGTGTAAFTVAVKGEKASGMYLVTMRRERSAWKILRAYVRLENNEEIPVVDSMNDSSVAPGPDMDPDTNHNHNANQPSSNRNAPISGGVLNGKATSKPVPPYPAVAKAARAEGTVTVEVVVDEEGKVISAKAVSGHPLLRAASESAARQARFSPTLLSGKPVKVKGILTYDFKLE